MRTILIAAGCAAAVVASPALAQDPAAGERVFAQCRACHMIGENAQNRVGPPLNGLFGRQSGSMPGFRYSQANQNANITWSDETFTRYIRNPREVIPGTTMVFAGLRNDQQIADLIAYLKQFDATGKRSAP
jgi:cytochrome c